MSRYRHGCDYVEKVARFRKMVESKNPKKECELRKTLSIYKVHPHLQAHEPRAYKPSQFTFGPVFHKDRSYNQSYKNSAVFFFIKRAKKCVGVFINALEDVIKQVTMSYDPELSSYTYGEAYLEMMLVDGCFMLEIMRAATESIPEEYPENDRVFSSHGLVHMLPIIKRDMMILENQLPLVVLERLAAVESGESNKVEYINTLVLKFYNVKSYPVPTSLFLHVLDAYKKSSFNDPARKFDAKFYPSSSAVVLPISDHYRAGLGQFTMLSNSNHNLNGLSFRNGKLCLPELIVDNNTEVYFRNLIAFEKLHHGAGGDVASYISFMSSIIHSAQDVALLNYNGIIYNVLGSYEAVASIFRKLSKEVEISADSHLNEVRIQLGDYHFQLFSTYYRNLCQPKLIYKN